MIRYRLVDAVADTGDLEATLNEFAADGWRLVHVVPAWHSFDQCWPRLVLEREEG